MVLYLEHVVLPVLRGTLRFVLAVNRTNRTDSTVASCFRSPTNRRPKCQSEHLCNVCELYNQYFIHWKVLLVDYGQEEEVRKEELKVLDYAFRELPAQAIRFEMFNVTPGRAKTQFLKPLIMDKDVSVKISKGCVLPQLKYRDLLRSFRP